MIEITQEEFEQMIAWRDRVGREAYSEKPSRGELSELYQRMEILLREIKERQGQESST
jgi:hypothetical protein